MSGEKQGAPKASLPQPGGPFVYFEEARTFGSLSGIIQITLEAVRLYSEDTQVVYERVAVAHLRMSLPAAMSLRNAIDGAVLLARAAESQAQN